MRFRKTANGILVPHVHEILVPKYAEGEITTPSVGYAGYFAWELRRGGKVIRDSGGFSHNLLVDLGLENLSGNGIEALIAKGNMGTSGVAPANGDINLGAEVGTARQNAVVSVGSTYVAGPPDYWYRRYTYNFLEAFANGNLTEIGLFHPGGSMAIRQLLKDGTGTPTTVVKTAVDQLLITFEMRVYLPQVDVGSVVNISGVNYTVVTRVANAVNSGAWGSVHSNGVTSTMGCSTFETDVLGIRTSNPGGSWIGSSDHTQTAYVAGSYYTENKEVWDVGVSNYGTGIGSIESFWGSNGGFSNLAMFQHSFAPKIPKTNVKKLTIFQRRSWARYP